MKSQVTATSENEKFIYVWPIIRVLSRDVNQARWQHKNNFDVTFSGVPKGEKAKCVLYFRTDYSPPDVEDFGKMMLQKAGGQLVVAGGMVDYLIPEDEPKMTM